MFPTARGTIIKILFSSSDLQELLVTMEETSEPEKAYNYPVLNRMLAVGDRVLLNTAAVKLSLGTGGRHFVIPEGLRDSEINLPGHIMKLRYTPWQFPVLAVEEEDSPFHRDLLDCFSLEGVPVVIAPLHSMLPGIILGFRRYCKIEPKIAYVMTDGAAIPLALSQLVRELKGQGLLQSTITAGHAFGGDYEAVSIPSALVAAVKVASADLVICSLGPGIVGTGTGLGFSGIEQSWIIDLTARLNGIPVVTPRISTADPRERHRGLSHHSLTILNLANQPAFLALSQRFPDELIDGILTRLRQAELLNRHHWFVVDDPPAADLFKEHGLVVKTMGRTTKEDPWFFQSSVASGVLAALASIGKLTSLKQLGEGIHG